MTMIQCPASLPILLALLGLILFGQAPTSTPRRCSRRCCWSGRSTRPSRPATSTKPWSWADTWPVARIEVKRIGASAIVLAGSSGQALAFGPGHVELTADAGERGIAVYSAHRDTHFRFLRNVKIGDEIDVTRDDGKTFRYRAEATRWCVSMPPASIRWPTAMNWCYRPAGRSTR